MRPLNLDFKKLGLLAGLSLGLTCGKFSHQDSVGAMPSGGGGDLTDTRLAEPRPRLTSEEKELLEYCQKVREISDRQEETDRKLEEILLHLENTPSTIQAVALDDAKKKELKDGWIEIEIQKADAIHEINSGTRAVLAFE